MIFWCLLGPSSFGSNFDSPYVVCLYGLTSFFMRAEFPTLHLDWLVYLIAGRPAKVEHKQAVKVAHGVIMCVPLDLKNEDSQNAETMTPHRPFIIPLDL